MSELRWGEVIAQEDTLVPLLIDQEKARAMVDCLLLWLSIDMIIIPYGLQGTACTNQVVPGVLHGVGP